jgi:hypothetical protein
MGAPERGRQSIAQRANAVGVRHDLSARVEFGSVAPFRGFAAIRTELNPAFARWAKFWRPWRG